MKNRIFSLLIVLLLLMSLISVPVFAREPLDTTLTGTITVSAKEGEISGAVTLYRVADISVSNGDYYLEYTQEFAGVDLPLEDLENPEFAVSLAAYIDQNAIDGETKVFDDHTVVFEATAGLYLVVHTGAVDSGNTFVPFLIVFPGIQDDEFDYDVTATPKIGPSPEIPELPTETVPETTPPVPPAEKLPQTGQLNWPVPLLAVAGMLLFTVGWLLRFRGREENYDA